MLKLQVSVVTPRIYMGCKDLNSCPLDFRTSALTHWAISLAKDWLRYYILVLGFKRIYLWLWLQNQLLLPRCGFDPTPVTSLSTCIITGDSYFLVIFSREVKCAVLKWDQLTARLIISISPSKNGLTWQEDRHDLPEYHSVRIILPSVTWSHSPIGNGFLK